MTISNDKLKEIEESVKHRQNLYGENYRLDGVISPNIALSDLSDIIKYVRQLEATKAELLSALKRIERQASYTDGGEWKLRETLILIRDNANSVYTKHSTEGGK